jgi:hypothetical protein
MRKGEGMDNKIKIYIYGLWDEVLGNPSGGCGGCSSHSHNGGTGCGGCVSKKGTGCSGCGAANGSGNKITKDTGQYYTELVQFIKNSDVKDNIELEFIELSKINILDYDDIRTLDELGYEAPYVVLDGLVRYYGGISKELIYKDVKELLEV